tara:strand:+ start:10329 stop:11366 length:1038 start_codon:yes stop_codon:yes gene_type:complete
MKDVTDLHIEANIPLPTPGEFLEEIPRNEAQAAFVSQSRQHIAEILYRRDPRLLFVVGPCSIHDTKAGLEYAERLRDLAEKVNEKVYIVMRAYFEKPRTTLGWKGLIMDPHLDGTDDIPEGLRQARQFLRELIDLGMPTATELLDPITPQYIADFICWSAIGARTTESQTHRQMASGLSMPVGFKNSTPGSLAPAINAILAATQPQTFLGISSQGTASSVRTSGNPHCHIILRGGSNGPNYSAQHVAETEERLEKAGLPQTMMIDCSHGNSDKDHNRQPAVLEDILAQRAKGNRSITAIMMESNLKAGNQKFPSAESLNYGQSITDACIDWKTTERVILDAAEAL